MKHDLLLLALLLCASPMGFGDASLRVMTYNIHHGEGLDKRLDLDRIAAVIKEAHPDVVCLQEMDRDLPRTNKLDFPALLAEKLGMVVAFVPNYQFDGGDYGNATLTRLEIVETENNALPTPPGIEPRGCLRTTLRVDGRLVDVFNTHLGLKPAERKAQATAICEKLGERPTILMGDLNEPLTGDALGLFQSKLHAVAIDPSCPVRDTIPANAPHTRIDFILVSADVQPVSSVVLKTSETEVASDHLPCVADLRLPSSPGQPAR